mgnify:CR=1 FL=1
MYDKDRILEPLFYTDSLTPFVKNKGTIRNYLTEIIRKSNEKNIPSNVRIWVVGIELEGTNGRFRLAEDYLIKKDYRKIAEHKFDVGIYAVEYKK